MGISCVFLLRRILVFRCVEAITIVDSNVGCLAVTTAAAAAVFVVVVLLLYCCYCTPSAAPIILLSLLDCC